MRPPGFRPCGYSCGSIRVLLALLALLIAGPPSAFGQVDESALKAAFVYNIVAFTSWSDAGNAGPGADANLDMLVICTDANTPLSMSISHLAGRTIGQRRIAVHPAVVDESCNVLVHGRQTTLAPATLPHALLICDGCELPNGITAVTLMREGNRIRFDIDPARAANSGISFSSQLLRLARRIK